MVIVFIFTYHIYMFIYTSFSHPLPECCHHDHNQHPHAPAQLMPGVAKIAIVTDANSSNGGKQSAGHFQGVSNALEQNMSDNVKKYFIFNMVPLVGRT